MIYTQHFTNFNKTVTPVSLEIDGKLLFFDENKSMFKNLKDRIGETLEIISISDSTETKMEKRKIMDVDNVWSIELGEKIND